VGVQQQFQRGGVLGHFAEPAFALGDGFGKASALDEQLDEPFSSHYGVGLALKCGSNRLNGAAPVLLHAAHLRKAQIALQRRIARLHGASQHPRRLLQPSAL
jgi:hypothetical protein